MMRFLAVIALAVVSAAPVRAGITVSVDMDPATPGIQSVRTAAVNDIITVALVMTVDAAGVSSYGVSVNFDNGELSLNGAPASTELLPAGLTSNLNAGVNSESQAFGQVRTFEAVTLGNGPVSTSFTIGTISFKVTNVNSDGSLDVTPGLLSVGIDGVFDNSGNAVVPTFVGGRVDIAPPPTVTTLSATNFTSAGATLNGTVNANGSSTAVSFDYGTTVPYSNNSVGAPALVTGSGNTAVSAALGGLAPGNTYHFRVKGVNGSGTTNGSDLTFTTLTLQEAWRFTYFGTTSNTGTAADTADPDGDGFNNLFEYVAGLIPTSAASLFNTGIAPVAGQPGQKAIIFGPIVAGRTYVVTSKASLTDSMFLPLTSFTTVDNGAQRTVTDLSATGGMKFYRVEITLP